MGQGLSNRKQKSKRCAVYEEVLDAGKESAMRDYDLGGVRGDSADVEGDDDALEKVKAKWDLERAELKKQIVVLADKSTFKLPTHVIGCDVTYSTKDATKACAAVVVLERECTRDDVRWSKVVHSVVKVVDVPNTPYIPGYLGFKEVPILAPIVQSLPKAYLVNCTLMVDGNGILHPDEFGSASHLGVACNLPSIGVAKRLHSFPGIESEKKVRKDFDTYHKTFGDACYHTEWIWNGYRLLGTAMTAVKGVTRPIYVSVGHKTSNFVAVTIARRCSEHRIPEPVRQADLRSREELRQSKLL